MRVKLPPKASGVVRRTHHDHVRRELVDVTDAGAIPSPPAGAHVGDEPELRSARGARLGD